MSTALITGATGFIGHRVAAATAAAGHERRLAVHRRVLPPDAHPGAEVLAIDLTDPRSMRTLCDSVDVVLHCASHVSDDAALCDAINARGTRAIVEESVRSGVHQIVYVSTAAVYGDGRFERVADGALQPRPASAASRSRLRAEREVLRVGGAVLRPYLVYGSGDRWFIPAYVRLSSMIGGLVDGGGARLSLVDVNDLARAVVAASDTGVNGIFHAGHPEPVTLHDLHTTVAALLGLPVVDVTYQDAVDRLAARGGRRHHLDLVATDHWFESSRLWSATACDPGPPFDLQRLRVHAEWYRHHLGRGFDQPTEGEGDGIA